MKLHRLKMASEHDVRKWLEKELQLSDYQKSKLYHEETIRNAPFEFYEQREDESVNILWRLSIIPYGIYWIILLIGLPFTFLVIGKWGYGKKLFKFHSKWMNKLKL